MKKCSYIFLCMLMTLTSIFYITLNNVNALEAGLKVHFINVGGADSILVQCNGEVALIDGGYATIAQRKEDDSLKTIVDQTIDKKLSNQTDKQAFMNEVKKVLHDNPQNDVVNYLKKQGISKIDVLISSHPHMDHVSGLLSVLCNFEVKRVIKSTYTYTTSYAELFDAMVNELVANGKINSKLVPDENESFQLGGTNGAKFTNLTNPSNTYSTDDSGNDVNNYSLVFNMKYGERTFLFTGDVQRRAQANLLRNHKNQIIVDILKQPHHGYSNMDEGYSNSKYSGNYDFTKVVNADITAISCDGTTTPTTKVLNDAANSNVYMTYKSGNIVMSCDGKKVDIQYGGNTVHAYYSGDLNGDGKITPSDYVQVRRQLLKTMTLKGFARKTADVNGDGKITPSDYVLIRRHLLGTYHINS